MAHIIQNLILLLHPPLQNPVTFGIYTTPIRFEDTELLRKNESIKLPQKISPIDFLLRGRTKNGDWNLSSPIQYFTNER